MAHEGEKRLRIGIDARFFGSLGKGLGRYTEKLIEHLEEGEAPYEYFVFLRKENFEEYEPQSARFTKIRADYPWYGWREQVLFPVMLAKFRLDVMHFPHFNVPLFYRRPFVVTIHDLILLHYPTLRNTSRFAGLYWLKFAAYRLVIASAIRRARRIVTVSQFTKNDLIRHYPHAAPKISVTYEAASPYCSWLPEEKARALFRRLGLLEERETNTSRDILKPYFLYVGNAYPHKNLEALVRAAPLFPEYFFVIVGKEDYFYRRLKKTVEKKRVANIIFAGFATDLELGALYRSARLYLFPTLYEGFGLPPLEAMNYGLPVLASCRGSLPEILGDAARYFDPGKVGAMEEAMREILAHPEREEELRRAGYRRTATFRWDRMARVTEEVYRSVPNKEKK